MMSVPAATPTAAPHTPATGSEAERRGSGRRARARDRLMDRAIQPYAPNPALSKSLRKSENVKNLLLFVDDDLRETALAMTRIEDYLTRTLAALEARDLRREDVHALAHDDDVLDHLDLFNETLESLRRRLARLSSEMK